MAKKEKKPGVFKEFIAFINKGNALALAIGVIIGAAFGAIVTAINVNVISPLIAWLIGDTNLSESLITELKPAVMNGDEVVKAAIEIKWGALIQAVIDFLLIAIILFVIVKIVSGTAKRLVKAKEKAKAKLEARKKAGENVEEEEAALEEAAPAPAVDPSVELLTEIRDLLKAKQEPKEE